ncbi:MAG: putative glycoside hydrolase [Minisyncoccota bacterium]
MKNSELSKGYAWVSVMVVVFLCISIFVLPFILDKNYSSKPDTASVGEELIKDSFIVTHVSTPEPMKAIYMTACVASTDSWRYDLAEFVDETELNAIMIDIKDYSGTISIVDPKLENDDAPGCKVKDMREFVAELHEMDIYVIGRITVFQDPYYTKLHPEVAVKSKSSEGSWEDDKGLAFVDVGAREYWSYIVELSKISYELGFDEINFDYIRYPSDGRMSDALYTHTVGTSTKSEMLESFFSYLHQELKDTGMKTSADLFGLTTLAVDDMGIGQILEKVLPYFDFIYPMVYPSHYAWNTGGFGDPALHPYDIVRYSMTNAVEREQALNIKMGISTSTPSKLKPWIQDFDLGAVYDAEEVRAQIKATYDSGLTGWLSWDAANRYTIDAYLPAHVGLTE